MKIIQGDVILKRIKKLPKNLKKVEASKKKGEGLIVQFSEVTGHHHHFKEDDLKNVELFTRTESLQKSLGFTTITEDGSKFLSISAPTKMYHGKGFVETPSKLGVGDHDALTIPTGLYEMKIVREYDYNLKEERKIRD